MRIRKAKVDDVKKIDELGRDVSEFSVSKDTVNFWPKKILRNCIQSKSGFLFVAEENEEIVGFIIINHNPTFKKAIIENIFITPSHRNREIAKKLLKTAIEKLKSIKCEYVCALVDSQNEKAEKFYITNGLKKGKAFVWMDKILSKNFKRKD
ncbi:MAG: GNAT family N-acetyltransferase [Parcubacteria group bacterium]|jgi:ribosomal protein S18 acetylase RimI-like enzyme